MKTLISKHKANDNNIFHIFLWDIIRFYSPYIEKVRIYTYDNILNKDNPCQKWRIFVWNLLCDNVDYISHIPARYKQEIITPIYNHMNKIKYSTHPNYLCIYDKISKNMPGKYILLNQRYNDNRTLYDDEKNILLENCFENIGVPFKVCDFGKMTQQEQYDMCSEAKVFICMHGAGCTNLIFTPKNTPLIEISFRTHWYCDPVCDDHLQGKILIHEKCNGKLQTCKEYHKNDYHNLCYLLGKPYYEINPVRYEGGFINNNPISKRRIYVNSNEIIQLSRKLFLS